MLPCSSFLFPSLLSPLPFSVSTRPTLMHSTSPLPYLPQIQTPCVSPFLSPLCCLPLLPFLWTIWGVTLLCLCSLLVVRCGVEFCTKIGNLMEFSFYLMRLCFWFLYLHFIAFVFSTLIPVPLTTRHTCPTSLLPRPVLSRPSCLHITAPCKAL